MFKQTYFQSVILIVYLLGLYIIAFLENRNSRKDNDILWVGREQWGTILIMWFPSFMVVFLGDR